MKRRPTGGAVADIQRAVLDYFVEMCLVSIGPYQNNPTTVTTQWRARA
jgi:hypothetical protein